MLKTVYLVIPQNGVPAVHCSPPPPLLATVTIALDLEIPDELFTLPTQKASIVLERPKAKSIAVNRRRNLDLTDADDKIVEGSEH